jgi:hypothetical protein
MSVGAAAHVGLEGLVVAGPLRRVEAAGRHDPGGRGVELLGPLVVGLHAAEVLRGLVEVVLEAVVGGLLFAREVTGLRGGRVV